MKKSFYLISLAAMVIAGCAKETPVTNDQPVQENKVVKLYATMPEFVDAQTKATVVDNGAFSWEESDRITVFYEKAGESDVEVTFLCSDVSKGEFEPADVNDIPAGYTLKTTGTVAYYPTSYRGTATNGSYDSLDEAKVSFQMHATNDNGTLKFVHDNALLKVTVENVPSFAKKLTVGGVDVTLNLTAAGNVTAYVPVAPAAAAKMEIAVTEGSNTIISKSSKNAVALAAANLYTLPTLTIGPVILIKNNVEAERGDNSFEVISSVSGAISFHTYQSGIQDYTTYSKTATNLKNVIISGVSYGYFVYPATCANQSVHVNIHCLNQDYPKVEEDITLSEGETFYTFTYALGLKTSSDKFLHVYHENDDKSGFAYASPSSGTTYPFGYWDGSTYHSKEKGYTEMWAGHRIVRHYDLSLVSTSYTLQAHPSNHSDWIQYNSAFTTSQLSGDMYLGFWYNNDSSNGCYIPGSYSEFAYKSIYQ